MDIFVNRNNERKRLTDLVQSIGIENKCVFIVGESGIGKSELSNYFMLECVNDIPIVIVDQSKSINNNYADGGYLREIAKKIDNNPKFISLKQYIKRLSSEVFKERIYSSLRHEIIKKFLPIGNNVIQEFSNAQFNDGIFNSDQILSSYNAEHYSLIKDYLSFFFRENSIILNIENIQNIDKSSLADLGFVFSKSKGSVLLLEYTKTDDSSAHSLHFLIDFFEKKNIEIEIINLSPLSISDIKLIIEQYPDASWDLLENSLINWKGNLKPLIDLLTQIKYDPSFLKNNTIHEVNNFTEESIKNLESGVLHLLIFISEHNEPVNLFLIDELIKYPTLFPNGWNIKTNLEHLIKYKFIIIDNLSRYFISHDSITNIIKQNKQWTRFRLISKKIWYEIYCNDSIAPLISRSVKLGKMLYYASCLCLDNVIISSLDGIYKESLICKSPDILIEYVLSVRKRLKKDGVSRKEIDFWLIILYYNLADSNNAIKIIEDTQFSSRLLNLITILVYEEIGEKRKALDLCNHELQMIDNNNINYELALRTTRLMLNFVLENYDDTKNEYDELYNNPRYKNLFEYGFLLRNAELIYSETSFRDSLIPIWESVRHFKKYGAINMEAYSRITYGVQIALTGNFKTALKQFEISSKLLNNVVTERHSVLNNIAVVNLYLKKYEEVRSLLTQALNTSERDFDTTAIYMNYLALLDWTDDIEEANQVVSILLQRIEKRTFQSIELVAGCYYNISKHYERNGLIHESEKFKNLIYNLPMKINRIWQYRLQGKSLNKNDNDYIESTVDRSLSFISNWHLEINTNLMHYE